jgi:nitrite reductase (cytochrome c-552)
VPEKELEARVLAIQGPPSRASPGRGAGRPPTSSTPPDAKKSEAGEREAARHRKVQWRLDFVAADNSMGSTRPEELARIRGQVIAPAPQGQLEAERAMRRK